MTYPQAHKILIPNKMSWEDLIVYGPLTRCLVPNSEGTHYLIPQSDKDESCSPVPAQETLSFRPCVTHCLKQCGLHGKGVYIVMCVLVSAETL
jgi:hypothetical protein